MPDGKSATAISSTVELSPFDSAPAMIILPCSYHGHNSDIDGAERQNTQSGE